MSKRREYEVTCLRRVGGGHAVSIAGETGETALAVGCADVPPLGRTGLVELPRELAARLGLHGDTSDAEEWDPEETPPAYALQWRQAAETNERVAARAAGGAP